MKKQENNLRSIAIHEENLGTFRTLSAILITLFVIFLSHSVYSMYRIYTSEEIITTKCPRADMLDGPVIMKTISNTSHATKDKWFKSYVRHFLKYSFPRKGSHAKFFFTNVKNMSRGLVKYKAEEYLDDIVNIKSAIDDGSYWRFYPKNNNEIRIIKDNSETSWTAEIDSYLIRHAEGQEYRYTPIINLEIEIGATTRSNPFGLYVTSLQIYQNTDYMDVDNKIELTY